jgi:hypothetical protein
MANDPRLSVQIVFVKDCVCGHRLKRATEIDREHLSVQVVTDACQSCDRVWRFDVSEQPPSVATDEVKKTFVNWLERYAVVKHEAISLWPQMLQVSATEVPR